MDLQLVDDEFPSDEELVFEHQTNTVQGEEFTSQGEVFPVEVSEAEFPEHAQYVEYERTLVNRIRRTVAPGTAADLQPGPVSIATNYSEIKEFLFSEHISYLSPFYPKNKRVEISADTIAKKQKDLPEDFRAGCAEVDGLLYFQEKLVIPRSLLGHFMVKNHMDKCHPSLAAEKKSISRVYLHGIPKGEVLELLKSFRQRCLHCQREPHILRRPYNLIHLAKRAREILRADYLYVNQTGYILVLMDSCTRKLMLFYSEAPTAKTMADALLQWRSDLGFNDYFLVITDNGSHFSNNLLKALTKNIGFEQAFSVAYSPWTNGAVEVVNSAILRCIRSLTSQYRLHESEWPKLLTTISYIINNRPSERRLNKSPNELFLYYKLTTPLLQQSPKHFSISTANNVKEPLDVAILVEQAEELRGIIESVQEEVYTEVKFRRDMENSRLNKKRKVIFQFSQGDYVLVSEYGTLNAKEKTHLNWIGPYQITNIVSKDVYEVESLLGKRRVIHASRLWFYSDEKPLGNKNLKALFVHNFQSLEINKLKKIQLFSSPSLEYKVRVSWLGFSAESDTWEPLDTIYHDVPLLVRDFVNKIRDRYRKEALLAHLQKLDASSQRGNTNVRRANLSNFNATTNFDLNEARNTLGWFDEEKNILCCLVKKFGCGNYDKYNMQFHLPYRTKQQVTTQIQSILNLQAISIFHNLRFDLFEAREYLRTELGINKFHKNLPGRTNMFSEKDAFLKQFKNVLCKSSYEDLPIPYFRRINDLRHIKLLLSEVHLESVQGFIKKHSLKIPILKRKLADHTSQLEEIYTQNKEALDTFYSIVSINDDFWTTLSSYWCTVRGFEGSSSLFTTSSSQYSISEDQFSVSMELHDEDVVITLLDLDKVSKVILNYQGGNLFQIAGATLKIYFRPAHSRVILENIFSMTYSHPTRSLDIYTLAVMDPPWKVGVTNPTRGVSLDYPTLSLEKFSKITLPLANFRYGSLLFVWVTNYSYFTVLKWANSLKYFLIDNIIWIKRNNSGKLHKSLGYILQHSKEICLVFMRKENEKLTYSDTFFEIFAKEHSNLIYALPEKPSVKTELFYALLDRSFPQHRKIEFFARTNNVRCNWTSTGLDLSPSFHVNYS
eukprot:snap_masked-scaffold_23-processed-gene-2.9-mRNA-1 protein AED:0.45 eAED:0.45 QI:0/-1/0/1/-1/1/1/0/1117